MRSRHLPISGKPIWEYDLTVFKLRLRLNQLLFSRLGGMKYLSGVLAWLLFIVSLSPGGISAAEPVKIGVLLPLTGSQAESALIEKKSFLMAADAINAAGGVHGKKIELIIADTQGNPDNARAAIEKLIRRDQVLVIGGGFSSSATWATISIAQQNKIPFLVNSAAADKITEQGWEYIFRLNQPVSEYFGTFVSFVTGVASDIRSVAIVHDNTLTGASEARRFFKTTQVLGLKLAVRESYEAGGGDFKALLARVRTQRPDLIYMVAQDVRDAAALTGESREIQLDPKLFVGAGAGFLKFAGKASEHVTSLVPWVPSAPYPDAKELEEKFIAKYHFLPGYHGAEAYAGMQVIGAALKRTLALKPVKVRDALAATELMTVYGPVKFSSYGKKQQQNKLPTLLVQWIEGKQEVIWPQSLATKRYVYPALN
jgi:branched-chain amino acid transport system substrate-binding protein